MTAKLSDRFLYIQRQNRKTPICLGVAAREYKRFGSKHCSFLFLAGWWPKMAQLLNEIRGAIERFQHSFVTAVLWSGTVFALE
jgi:hypothetical protein